MDLSHYIAVTSSVT